MPTNATRATTALASLGQQTSQSFESAHFLSLHSFPTAKPSEKISMEKKFGAKYYRGSNVLSASHNLLKWNKMDFKHTAM